MRFIPNPYLFSNHTQETSNIGGLHQTNPLENIHNIGNFYNGFCWHIFSVATLGFLIEKYLNINGGGFWP